MPDGMLELRAQTENPDNAHRHRRGRLNAAANAAKTPKKLRRPFRTTALLAGAFLNQEAPSAGVFLNQQVRDAKDGMAISGNGATGKGAAIAEDHGRDAPAASETFEGMSRSPSDQGGSTGMRQPRSEPQNQRLAGSAAANDATRTPAPRRTPPLPEASPDGSKAGAPGI